MGTTSLEERKFWFQPVQKVTEKPRFSLWNFLFTVEAHDHPTSEKHIIPWFLLKESGIGVSITPRQGQSLRGVVANVLDLRHRWEFELQSCYYVHFRYLYL